MNIHVAETANINILRLDINDVSFLVEDVDEDLSYILCEHIRKLQHKIKQLEATNCCKKRCVEGGM